ncbi:MAG: hypothetical protein WCT26_00930 [Candidatus Buchananbacteria bacterium]|jgi:hypothetical protein
MEQVSTQSNQLRPKIAPIRDLIKSSLSDYRQNWQKFAYLLIIPLLITYLASIGSFALSNFANTSVWPWQLSVAAGVVFLVLIVAFAYLYVLTYISEFLLLKDLSQEVNFSNLREWYKKAQPYFWISVAVSLIFTLLAVIGFILVIIPGIIFCIFYGFTIYAVIFEDHKFEGAFGRSRELVRGYWWAVFGRFVGAGAIVYVAYIIIGGIFAGIIWLIALALHLQSNEALFKLMYDLLSVFIGLAAGPLSMIYTYKIFKSLKEVKNT